MREFLISCSKIVISKYCKILILKLIINAVVIKPKKAPDISSIIPTSVISRMYLIALVTL